MSVQTCTVKLGELRIKYPVCQESLHYELNRPCAPHLRLAELKVHVFLNVGHQQGCKVVTSGTSVKLVFFFLPTCLSSLFIHCAVVELTVGFSDSGTST